MGVSFVWEIGPTSSSTLVIGGSPTTATPFNANYELRLMYIGYAPAPYSTELGYATFTYVNTGIHSSTVAGQITKPTTITGGEELNDRQYILALYEKATGKYYFISETNGGAGIDPYTFAGITGIPIFDFPEDYYPESSTGYFYKGAQIPPFCGWLASKGLVQANLAGLNENQVNLAFAVNANPTNFNGVKVSITDFVLGTSSLNGTFSCTSYDAQNHPSAVAKLNGNAALSLLASPTISGSTTTVAGASVNLSGGTFQATNGATNDTQFMRIKLTAPEVW